MLGRAGVCDWTLKGALSASLTRVHSRMDAQVVCGRSDQGGRLAGDLQDLGGLHTGARAFWNEHSLNSCSARERRMKAWIPILDAG